MKVEEIFLIGHDTRRRVDGGIKGTYTSLRNLVRNLVIYESFYVEHTRHSHALAEPIYKIIKNKELILRKLKDIDFNALELKNEEIDDEECYIIQTISGRKITILANKLTNEEKEKIDDLLENNEYAGDTSRKYIDQLPFLNYTNIDLNKKIDNFEMIKSYIENKDKHFLKLIDKECICFLEDGKKLLNRSQIKKYISSIIGNFGFKLRYAVSVEFYGFINNDKSDIMLQVHYYTTQNDRGKYILIDFEINSEGRIKTIKFINKSSIIGKELNDVAIKFVKNKTYDDFNEEIANEVKGSDLTWNEFLNKHFSSTGTRTKMSDIRLQPTDEKNIESKSEIKENVVEEKEQNREECVFVDNDFKIDYDYGKNIHNPIKLTNVPEIYSYLDYICLNNENEEDIKYKRIGSLSCDEYDNVDKFEIFNENDVKIDELYFWGYSNIIECDIPKELKNKISKDKLFNFIRVPDGYKVKIRKNLKIDWNLINIESIDKVKMTKREMLDFAIQIIVDYATKEGYEFESVNNTLSHFPNAYLKKDNELYCLIIEVDEVHNQPQLSIDTINKMKNIKNKINCIPIYASVGIGAVNSNRFDEKQTLIGDEYLVNFEGFQSITL